MAIMTTTTSLLPIRTADGRLRYASYKDEAEKARILAWAQANNARVGNAAEPQQGVLARVA
jgi:hypothetical protein